MVHNLLTAGGGGGGGTIDIQDEGLDLLSPTTLNFVGAGVTASGTGATKTITINGGSGYGDTDEHTSNQILPLVMF